MSDANDKVTFSLKALVSKDETEVHFVEADNHFVDVVLSFLTMPLGKIVRLLQKHYGDDAPAIGSLTTLYKGLENLGSVHFRTEGGKEMLLNPRNSSEADCRELKFNVDDEPTKYFTCAVCSDYRMVSMYGYDRCGNCRGKKFVDLPLSEPESDTTGDAGVFATSAAYFMIFDELKIVPISSEIGLATILVVVTKMEGAKQGKVSFGFNQIMDLLKGLFLSKTPLSDIILKDSCSTAAKPKPYNVSAILLDEAVSESKIMTLKLMVQKSTNKVLFAQAEADFVDFMFSFLSIPLGGVASLLQGDTSLINIDNLYDFACTVPDKYLTAPDIRIKLVKPKLGLYYRSSSQIFPLEEETYTPMYQYRDDDGKLYVLPVKKDSKCSVIQSFEFPGGPADYVRGPTAYMVTDDLVVTEYSIASSFSIIDGLNIPASDVKKLDLDIGLPEALCILKASLTSRSALTDALLKPMIKEEPSKAN